MPYYFLSFLAVVLSLFQLITSPKPALLTQTELEFVEQTQRMNDYPPQLYYFAHLIEQRPESRLFFRLQDNFFRLLNPTLLPFYLIPFIVIGFFRLIKNHLFLLSFLLIIPLFTLTLIGPTPTFGYLCLYPFLIISFFNGLFTILKK